MRIQKKGSKLSLDGVPDDMEYCFLTHWTLPTHYSKIAVTNLIKYTLKCDKKVGVKL
jgi:hypothetical protein